MASWAATSRQLKSCGSQPHDHSQLAYCNNPRNSQNSYFVGCGDAYANDVRERRKEQLRNARAAPVQVEKHGRPVVVVMSVEEFQRLNKPVNRSHDAMRKTVKVGR